MVRAENPGTIIYDLDEINERAAKVAKLGIHARQIVSRREGVGMVDAKNLRLAVGTMARSHTGFRITSTSKR